MSRPSLREKIIESGLHTLHRHGYGGAGVREITAEAGVPQGSFTNHFPSKEAFAVVVLDRYRDRTLAIMDTTLRDATRTPIARLHAYFDAITTFLEGAGWQRGCLVGNMSLEAADQSEPLRESLVAICDSFQQAFQETIRAGQTSGDIRRDIEPADLAMFVLSSWQGAMMRMKVNRSPTPIEQFKRVLFAIIGADQHVVHTNEDRHDAR